MIFLGENRLKNCVKINGKLWKVLVESCWESRRKISFDFPKKNCENFLGKISENLIEISLEFSWNFPGIPSNIFTLKWAYIRCEFHGK
jgi:hypothetical protein